jgi:hypothetical protein
MSIDPPVTQFFTGPQSSMISDYWVEDLLIYICNIRKLPRVIVFFKIILLGSQSPAE